METIAVCLALEVLLGVQSACKVCDAQGQNPPPPFTMSAWRGREGGVY